MAFNERTPERTDVSRTRAGVHRADLRDKVAIIDPAAAPMDTDAEAAQAATPQVAIRAADLDQKSIAARRRAPPLFAAHLQPGQSRLPSGWAAATLVALIGFGVLAGVISSGSAPEQQQAQESGR